MSDQLHLPTDLLRKKKSSDINRTGSRVETRLGLSVGRRDNKYFAGNRTTTIPARVSSFY
jgi:hypothetical protein